MSPRGGGSSEEEAAGGGTLVLSDPRGESWTTAGDDDLDVARYRREVDRSEHRLTATPAHTACLSVHLEIMLWITGTPRAAGRRLRTGEGGGVEV